MSSNPKFAHIINILIADIPEFYGLVLSRDWSEKLHGYFAIDWSHMWLPYNGNPNQIKFDGEKHMKYSVTDLGEENEPIAFNNNILGNYSVDSFLRNFNAQSSPFTVNFVNSQV